MKRKSFLLSSLRTLSNPSTPRTLSNLSTPSNLSNPSNPRTLSNPSSLSTLSSPILRSLGFLWLLAACSLTSCSSDSSGSPASIVEEPVAKPRPLTVEVTETPFHSQTNEQGARQLTRASEITISSLKNFFVFNNQNTDAISFSKSGSNWGGGDWPVADDDSPVTFYATNIADDSYFLNGTNSFSFTVLEDVFNQIDLLAAKTTAAYSAGKGKISLAFDHITTAVTFSIKLSENAAAKEKTVKLKKAMLYNIPNTATYSFTSDSWGTPAASKSDYTLTTGDITLSTELKQLPCKYLFLIPQTLSAYHAESNPNGAYLEVELTVNSGAVKTVRYPVALTLEQGWIQPVNIVIKAGTTDTDGKKIFNEDVDELTN